MKEQKLASPHESISYAQIIHCDILGQTTKILENGTANVDIKVRHKNS